MIHVADQDGTGASRRLHLRVTTQAKIRVAFDQHLPVDRAVGIMADRAAFAHGLVLEDKRAGLVAMALRAALILPGHGQPAFWFQNITSVRVVTLHATHMPLNDGVMLRQIEFTLDVQMTLETGRRIGARVDDEFRVTAGFDVFAAGTVAGFATGFADHRRVLKMNPGMGAGGKLPDNFGMAVHAGLVTDIMGAWNFQRHHYCRRRGGTGIQKRNDHTRCPQNRDEDGHWLQPHPGFGRLAHAFQR